MQYQEARRILGQMKTARLHARQANDYIRADVLTNKIRQLKQRLKEFRQKMYAN